MSEIFKFLLGVLLMLVVSALLAFNALLIWVATGPRTFDALTPYIESGLSSSDGSYNVKIGKTHLIWDGWTHPVDIRIRDVSVLTVGGKKLTSFPEIALGVDVFYLPFGRIMPTSLKIYSPLISVEQNDDFSFDFGFKAENNVSDAVTEPSQTVPFSTVVAPFLEQGGGSNFGHLHTVIIDNAELKIRNSRQEVFFDTRDFSVVISRNRKGAINANSKATIYYGDYNSNIHAEFSKKPHNQTIDGLIEFSEIMPDVLAGLFSDNPDIKSFAVPISGKASFAVNTDGIIQGVEFNVKGSQGTISSDKLISPLKITSLDIAGAVGNNFNQVRLDSFSANIDGVGLSANGSARFFDNKQQPDSSPEIFGEVFLQNVPSEKLPSLWPPSLSPVTREWVTENITGGKITESKVIIDLKNGDLKKPVLPKESIDATIDVEGLKVRYLPEHPAISHVKGRISIDGIALNAAIESADFLEKTKLSNGHVAIDDLNVDNPYINVDLHADAPAKDIVHFLGLPRLKHAAHLGLQEDTVTGNVKGEAKVGFNFFAPEGQNAEDVIKYEVKSEISNISQKNFLQKFDVVGASGNVNVDNKGLEFIGSGEINGAIVSKGNVKYLFVPEQHLDTFIDVDAKIGVENLKRFDYPELPFLKGKLGVLAKVKLGKKIEETEASLDLTDTAVDFQKILSWKKSIGEAVKLDIKTEKKDGAELKINSFNFSGKSITAKGSAVLARDMSGFNNIKFTELNSGDNDVSSLNYDSSDHGMVIGIQAKSLDLTDYMTQDSEGISFQNFPAIELKANIEKLIAGKDRIVTNFSGELICNKIICQSANLTGKTGEEKPFAIKLSADTKKIRKLTVRSEDAGSFLRVFGILNGMNGGKLNLSGVYQDSKQGSILKANLDISEHTIKDAPILGKILSLASLTGFIDALQGNGIRFVKLSMPFTLHNDVATFEKGKTYGSAIGITVDGTITFPKKTMDLQGTVVPSYTLNNFFGEIPLFGEMLTGGEGQGVFAARYSIKGVESKPDVSVNPLSILTPGFLRGLFDIFDGAKPKPDKNDEGN